VGHASSPVSCCRSTCPVFDTGVDTAPEAAIFVLIFLYAVAAWFNTRIPLTGVEMRPIPKNPLATGAGLLAAATGGSGSDKLGQISLATTTLFWGVSGNLRYIVLAWAGRAGLQHHAGLVAEWRGRARHRGRRDRRVDAHAAGQGHHA
jgi:hypothetical protein